MILCAFPHSRVWMRRRRRRPSEIATVGGRRGSCGPLGTFVRLGQGRARRRRRRSGESAALNGGAEASIRAENTPFVLRRPRPHAIFSFIISRVWTDPSSRNPAPLLAIRLFLLASLSSVTHPAPILLLLFVFPLISFFRIASFISSSSALLIPYFSALLSSCISLYKLMQIMHEVKHSPQS